MSGLSRVGTTLRTALVAIFTLALIALPHRIHAQQEAVHGIPDRVARLERLVSGQSEQLTQLQQQLAAVEQLVGAQTQHLQGLQDQLLLLKNALNGLTQQVSSLRRLSVTVNCDAGETIGAALQQGGDRASKVVITINGICHESVTVNRPNTELRAGPSGGGLQSPSADANVLSINAGDVLIDGLTLAGGSGVIISPRSRVTISRTRIADSGFHGLLIFGASVDVRDSVVENNAIEGIQALSGTRLGLEHTEVRGNGFGLDIALGSTASLDRDSIVAGNGSGVVVSFGSMLEVGSARIEENFGNGLWVLGGSTVHFGLAGGKGIIRNNRGHGLQLADTSVASALFMGGAAEITRNDRYGVWCSPAPAVAQLIGAIGTVEENGSGQVSCPIGF